MPHTKGKALFAGLKQKAQVMDKQEIKALALRYAVCSVVSFVFTRLTLFGVMQGFGFSFAVALPLPYAIVGWIGCLLGEIYEGLDAGTVFYILFLGLWVAVKKYITMTHIPKRYMGVFWQTAVIGAVLLCKTIAAYFLLDLTLLEFLLHFSGAVLQLVLFIASSVFDTAFLVGRKLCDYSRSQMLAAVMLGVTVIAALGRYRFLGITAAGIIAVMAVTAASYRFGCIGGAVSGIIAGMGLLLADMSQIEFVSIMTFGGFLAGLVAGRSKLTAAVSMMTVHYLLVLLYGKPLQMMPLTISTMFGVIAFLGLPATVLDAIQLPRVFDTHAPPMPSADMLAALEKRQQLKLRFAADTVCMLGVSVAELADILKKQVRPDMEQLYAAVEQKLCRRCKRRFQCYGSEYDRIRDSFNDLGGLLVQHVQIQTDSFPQFLKENCVRPNDLILAFTSAYGQMNMLSQKQRQLDRSRALVLEQYAAMDALLKELGETEHLIPDAKTEQVLMELLSKEGYAPAEIDCSKDPNGKRVVDLYYRDKTPPSGELAELMEKHLHMVTDAPVICDGKQLIRMTFYEPPVYGVELAITQKASPGSKVSGDTVVSFYDGRGSFYLLLSDGMGRGKRAALDSMTVCTILSKLLGAGFGWQASLKLLNTSLVIKSAEESLATVDIVKVNLHTGETQFIKAGAASSYWASEKNVSRIRSFTLPLGIVEGIGFDSKRVMASAGDTLLLVSDGVQMQETELAKQIISHQQKPLQALTDCICAEEVSKEQDDRTAAAVRLVLYRSEKS